MKNCQYRINENVYIGRSVRKTAGSGTMEYRNKPFTGAMITEFDNRGFIMNHPNFGKEIWLEFEQLPLKELTIVNGTIRDELIFVEHLFRAGGTQMFLVKTDSDEYREILEFDEDKKSSKDVKKLSELKPGDVVVSAVCEAGTQMIYLGNFYLSYIRKTPSYFNRYAPGEWKTSAKNLKRAIFLVEDHPRKYRVKDYATGNKFIKELWSFGNIDERFTDIEKNERLIRSFLELGYGNGKEKRELQRKRQVLENPVPMDKIKEIINTDYTFFYGYYCHISVTKFSNEFLKKLVAAKLNITNLVFI